MDKKDNNQEKRYPRFLDNKPCGQDLFDTVSKSVSENRKKVREFYSFVK